MSAVTILILLIALVPLVDGLCILASYLNKEGLTVETEPRSADWLVVVALVGFTGFLVFGGKYPMAAALGLTALVLFLQYSGPKKWRNGKLHGAWFVPLKVKHVITEGGKTVIVLAFGHRLALKETEANSAFLSAWESS